MAIADRTTPPAAAPCASQSAEDRPLYVLLAPNVTDRLNEICMQGDNLVQIAGLLELCSEDIHTEAVAIKELFPGAPMEHTQALTGYIGFLASTLRRMGEEIEKEGNEASDVVAMMAGGDQ
jgi:hypothetical protein